ncbi:methyl-accepting chemotaxis protein [Desulfobulbus sp.]|uniref:HAMP domain-containing methyl-accepting chemotaxis protein n=1 Tax=Desulfobulbus sp. TaxID=895 RepID=UPI00286EFBDB|nr:methyl-accepting chemotaxis protein [Desulfobulbus sp.]
MEQEKRQRRWFGNPFSVLTDKLNIRGKLMVAFAVMIILTLVVIVIATLSQRFANTTIDELVRVHGKIARLSLDIEKTVRVMNGYEKDFLLNYNRIGIAEAKNQYLNKFIAAGGEAYQKLYEIQQSPIDAKEKASAQHAMDAINNYLATFMSTVNILELQVNPEFGELTKLRQSVDILRQSMATVASPTLQALFQSLLFHMQEYTIAPDSQFGERVLGEAKSFREAIGSWAENPALQGALLAQIGDFTKWFADVVKTDETISNRIQAYQQAVKQAEPVIQAFLKNATDNEARAVVRMEEATALVQKIVIGVGIAAVLLGLLISFGLSKGLTRQINLIMELLSEMGMGNFKARTEVVSRDELGEMASALNGMLDSITALIQSQEERDAIQDSIMKLMNEISDLTEGDLTARAEVTEDITGAIADSFNTMAEQFGDIVRQVQSATFSVDATATDVSRRTTDLAVKSTDQAQQVSAAIKALNDMAASIRQVSEHAARSAEVSEMSRSNAREGADAVDKTNRAMDEIREQINETARSIKRLGESSMEIGNVVEIINNIADRTSILALNASIQAAMAGDAGYGFAVVAEEVQRLAESSSNSTKQIDMLVKSIQSEIKDVSNRMDESIGKVVQGSRLADGAHEKLQQIETVSNQLADLIEAITQAAAQQVQMSENLVENMVVVGGVSDETSKTSQETAGLMNLLNATAHKLREAVETFKIENAKTA